MTLYRTILLATDLSEGAEHVLQHAVMLAAQHAAELHVLHVMQEMDAAVVNYVASVMGEDRFADYELEHEAELKTELQAWITRVLVRVNVSEDCIAAVEVRHGHPSGEIVKFADTCDADLVVMGSHGKGRLQTFLLGSVAEQVLHRLRRSALIVPVPQP